MNTHRLVDVLPIKILPNNIKKTRFARALPLVLTLDDFLILINGCLQRNRTLSDRRSTRRDETNRIKGNKINFKIVCEGAASRDRTKFLRSSGVCNDHIC